MTAFGYKCAVFSQDEEVNCTADGAVATEYNQSRKSPAGMKTIITGKRDRTVGLNESQNDLSVVWSVRLL